MRWTSSRNAPPTRATGCDRMIIKAVMLFLIGMLVLAMFGRLRLPGADRLRSRKCRKCGRFKIGKGPCPCGEG